MQRLWTVLGTSLDEVLERRLPSRRRLAVVDEPAHRSRTRRVGDGRLDS